jgi:subtilisin family serine protease
MMSPLAIGFNAYPGEYIIKFKGKTNSAGHQKVMGKLFGKASIKRSFQKLNMHKLELVANVDANIVVSDLRNDPNVEYIEPNYVLTKQNDRDLNRVMSIEEARAFSNSSQSSSDFVQNLANVDVEQAWNSMVSLGANPEKPIVAVIDTGVSYTHDIFVGTGAIWSNTGEIAGNGIDDDANGYVDDVRGWNFAYNNNNPMDDDASSSHGTHVAGIVLGVGLDIFASPLSEAPVRIMPLKFMDSSGAGSTSDAIAAIYYAVNNGAQVINNSWGGGNYSQALHDALAFAYENRVTVVCAAGNYKSNNDTTAMYPANYPVPGLVTVGATTDWDTLASFSNFGISKVHVAAPGVAILSTKRNNTTGFMSGTSMAAPFVAGLVALALREAPDLSAYQIKNLLLDSSETISNLNNKIMGSYRVNANDAITMAKAQSNTQFSQPDHVASSADARGPASESSAGGCGTISAISSLAAFKSNDGNGASPSALVFAVLMLLPVLVWSVLRQRSNGSGRRRFDRFVMNSEIRVMAGDRELVGQMKTISVGGLSFQADALLEKGGVVTMQIASPDGKESVQVEGHIVWNECNKAYGVQFDHARDTVLSRIQKWTGKLVRVN